MYLRKAAQALSARAEVTIAAPDVVLSGLSDPSASAYSLGHSRPSLDPGQPSAPQHRELALQEIELLRSAAHEVRPDHVVHMYADPILRRLVEAPPLPRPTTLCLFFPRAHYPTAFSSRLKPVETARARFFERLVRRWRRRSDAHALFTLDPEAARRWAGDSGAPAYWFPEPPVELPPDLESGLPREGYLLYGTLARRKGLHLLAQAVASGVTPVKVVLAGEVEQGYEAELHACVSAMAGAGAHVELLEGRLSEEACLRLLRAAECALVPYPRHYGYSRVLLEAAAAGTPVLAHNFGLIGYLVERHALGVTVDCTNPRQFRSTLLGLGQDPNLSTVFDSGLESFAEEHSASRFQRSILAPFQMETNP